MTKLGAFSLRDEDMDDCKPSVGSLFAAKQRSATTALSNINNAKAQQTNLPSVAATLRSDATLASITLKIQNEKEATKRKHSSETRFIQEPNLSLISANIKEGEKPKKRKTEFCKFGANGDSQHESETRREELQQVIDQFVRSGKMSYTFEPDLNGHERKLVHEIAGGMDLIHESVGAGKRRRIILKKNDSIPKIQETNNVQVPNDKKMLPRRDTLPGERPLSPPPKTEETVPEAKTTNSNHKICTSVPKLNQSKPKATNTNGATTKDSIQIPKVKAEHQKAVEKQ